MPHDKLVFPADIPEQPKVLCELLPPLVEDDIDEDEGEEEADAQEQHVVDGENQFGVGHQGRGGGSNAEDEFIKLASEEEGEEEGEGDGEEEGEDGEEIDLLGQNVEGDGNLVEDEAEDSEA